MFVLSQQGNALFRVIATLVTIALVSWAVGFAYVRTAEAVSITDAYDLLSTSATSTASNHTIEFVTPTGIADGETIELDFDPTTTAFNLTGIGDEDIDILENGANVPVAGWSSGLAGDVLTITFGGDSIAAGATTTILIGTHATNEGSPDTQIVNPATQGSYIIEIGGTMPDAGEVQVAIVDSVYVTANVDTSFTFTVTGFAAAGTTVNGTSTTGTTTSIYLPFGTLTDGAVETLAQQLNVATNAINGFVVTAEVDQQLTSSTGADIDAFDDSVFLAPKAWESPGDGTPDVLDENTWGHWGWTTEDATTTRDAGREFGNDEWEGASTSPAVLFSHTGVSDGTTAGIGSTTVGFQAEITALQEAGDDYSATLTYIATPTF